MTTLNSELGISTPSSTSSPELTDLLQQIVAEQGIKGLAGAISAPRPGDSLTGKKDPLAADKNGWNLPKTGQVNTTGALQRINARTGETGVTATADAKGQLTLTNINPNVQSAHASFNPSGQVATNPLQMTSLLQQLRGVNTTKEASLIMDNLRTSITVEETKIKTDAFNFASGKLGIPAAEEYLKQSEMNDRGSPSWFPGIGDSPGTVKIRTQLGVLRGQATEQANLYLNTNLASGILKNSLLSANEELKRIDAAERRISGVADTMKLRSDEREAREDEATAAIILTLPPAYGASLKILNPGLTNAPESDVTRKAFALEVKNLTRNNGANPRMDAIKAAAQPAGTDLIGLAIEGNLDARTLLHSAEKLKNPSMKDSDFDAKLKSITDMADSSTFVATYIKGKYGAMINSPDALKEKEAMNSAKLGAGTAAEKATNRRNRIGTAIAMERAKATDTFLSDLTTWGSNDLLFRTAYNDTIRKRGKADFDTVMDMYIGTSTGAEAFKKAQALNVIGQEAFARSSSSAFGKPDESVMAKKISDKVKAIGLWRSMAQLLESDKRFSVPMPWMAGIASLAEQASSGLLGAGKVANDPITGLPFQR